MKHTAKIRRQMQTAEYSWKMYHKHIEERDKPKVVKKEMTPSRKSFVQDLNERLDYAIWKDKD